MRSWSDKSHKAIFFDRDGVIIRKAPDGEYISRWEKVRLLPGAVQAMAAFRTAGFKLIVVTNQRGIALGKTPVAAVEDIHRRLRARLARANADVAEIYFCPHDTWEDCGCRKPQPGMLLQAASEHRLDLRRCWMIGDSEGDVLAGVRAGCKAAWITSTPSFLTSPADLVAPDLPSATRKILSLTQSGGW